jgi:hypothetical protein
VKLLQSEIDVVPGRKPQKQPLPEGYVGTGIGTLRIDNATQRQNSYTIHVKCDQPFWQDVWCTISALAPGGGAENAPPSGKPDQPGPRGQSLTIFIKDGGVRDVLLSFFVPEKSECRAGVYKATVIVETRVVSDDPHAARKERITEIPISIIVRPFHKWQVSFSPEEKRVGLFRRKTDFELAVDNQGNDWLYVELKLPRPQNVLIDAKVQRLAVPPPDGDRESIRTAPVRAVTRQRVVRGARTPTPLPLTVQRIEAPSIPPLPEEAAFGPSGANLGAAVIGADTNDIGVPAVPSKVVYCPPIPDTLTGFLEAVVRNIKGLVVALIGLFIAWQVAFFVWDFYFKTLTEVDPDNFTVQLNKPFGVSGKNLIGSRIILIDPTTGKQMGQQLQIKPNPQRLNDAVFVTITDPNMNGKSALLGAQRLGSMTVLNSLLPVIKSKGEITIGNKPTEKKAIVAQLAPSIAATDKLVIGGQGFGSAKGKILVNGLTVDLAQVTWTDTQITIPNETLNKVVKLGPGKSFSVLAETSAGDSIPLTPNVVNVETPEQPATTGSTAGSTSAGTTGTPQPTTTTGTSTTTGGNPTSTSGGSTTTGGSSTGETTGGESNTSSGLDWDAPGLTKLSTAELKNLSKLQLDEIRNEAYARHGLIFKRSDLQVYFNGKPWYIGKSHDAGAVGNMLTPSEKAYVSAVKKVEDSK